MYGQFRTSKAADCLVLPVGIKPEEAGSAFVNPLTALWYAGDRAKGRAQGLVAYGSGFQPRPNAKPTLPRGRVPLVNIVRSTEQVQF